MLFALVTGVWADFKDACTAGHGTVDVVPDETIVEVPPTKSAWLVAKWTSTDTAPVLQEREVCCLL